MRRQRQLPLASLKLTSMFHITLRPVSRRTLCLYPVHYGQRVFEPVILDVFRLQLTTVGPYGYFSEPVFHCLCRAYFAARAES